MKPICVNCKLFFRPTRNGVYFTEAFPSGTPRPLPGTAEPKRWRPYKIWAGDRWRCPGCGATIIVGCGLKPIAEHYQDGFEEQSVGLGADKLQINDC